MSAFWVITPFDTVCPRSSQVGAPRGPHAGSSRFVAELFDDSRDARAFYTRAILVSPLAGDPSRKRCQRRKMQRALLKENIAALEATRSGGNGRI